jgi:hypothetical protein
MADFSAGQLSPAQAKAFEKHCTACASCRCEWETFQSTLELLSALPQTLPCEELSGEMWDCCCQDWIEHVEERRCKTGPLSALRRCAGWMNQQPRWAQSGWVASGVVVAGVALFWGGTWLNSYNVPADPAVVASNPSVVSRVSLPADGGPLRFMGRLHNNSSLVAHGLPVVGVEEAPFSSLPSSSIDFHQAPIPVRRNPYLNNRALLPVERFINRVNSGPFLARPVRVPATPYSSAEPFVFEVREKEGQVSMTPTPPLLHGE